MGKTAIALFSDPKQGSEEALGRLFNALFLAYDLKKRGQDVALIFQGTGTRWAAELAKDGHPASALFREVEDKVAGVSGGCAHVFGTAQEAMDTGLPMVGDLQIPDVGNVLSLGDYLARGYSLVTF